MSTSRPLLSRITLPREPIAWIGIAVVVLQIIQGVLSHQDSGGITFDAILSAIGAVVGRQMVTPATKNRDNDLPPIK